MSDAAAPSGTLSINVKGPQDVKLPITVPTGATVAELKALVAEANPDFPADQQRLIFSGRVLKDEELCSKYNLKDGHTIHLVKGARPAGPSGVPGTSAAAGVPSSFGAGQQVMGNPLAPLMNAQNAGALAGFNPFAEMGVNPNDPNYMQNMMRDPAVQGQINSLLSDPAVIDQLIATNPELAAAGPQVRQLMQSEQFRSFLTNPEAMQQAMGMMGGMGGAGGGGGGGFPPPGAFGWGSGAGAAGAQGQQGQQGQGQGQGLFNPWGSTPPSAATGGDGAAGAGATPPAAGAPGAFNPFAPAGGAGGAPNFQQMMQQMQQLQQLQQMFGGAGGLGGLDGAPATPSGPVVPPEERYATQLEQLAGMGFHDAAKNVRALLASGGNVEGAVGWLFEN
ncbi:hypothetical protein BCR35DRAFT_306768 [Leucosporidium creatinivorum]|uniref:Uncharacterized protein n=1 Tax=Leucosporidium creatinivorum TaxID=106004 RepID=A0A1Y2ES19_9BASI|nr:hypothetical protein BCR35DRAFT_306768 [Leucosporidium creatinivorum]